MLKRLLSLLLLTALSVQVSWAQYNNPTGRPPKGMLGFSIGVKGGTTIYFGDLVDGGRVKWTAGAYAEKTLSSWLSWRAELDAGQCRGGQDDNIEFNTTFFNLDLLLKCYFLDLIQGYNDQRLFNPYFAVGAGGMAFKCKKEPGSALDIDEYIANVGDEEMANKWMYYDGGMEIAGMATGIVGVRYQINEKLWATLEAKGDMLFTDYFDGHQGWPDGAGNWVDSEKRFDALWTISAGVQYRFYSQSKYRTSAKYSRKNYLKTRKIYERNAKRMRRL